MRILVACHSKLHMIFNDIYLLDEGKGYHVYKGAYEMTLDDWKTCFSPRMIFLEIEVEDTTMEHIKEVAYKSYPELLL